MEDKEYLYPIYSYPHKLIRGLFLSEWIIELGFAVIMIVIFRFTGILISCFICPVFYMLMRKDPNNRINLANQILHTMSFSSASKIMSARPRDAEVQQEEEKPSKRRKKPRNLVR